MSKASKTRWRQRRRGMSYAQKFWADMFNEVALSVGMPVKTLLQPYIILKDDSTKEKSYNVNEV